MRVKSNLKRLLDDREITMRDLERKSGVKFETIRRLYHDETVQYHRESIAAICVALEVQIGELLTIEHEAAAK